MATNLDHSAPDDVHEEKTVEEQPEAAAQTKAGVRPKVITEKAHEEHVRQLKDRKSAALRASTKSRNALISLLKDNNNLHLVKAGMEEYERRFDIYQAAFTEYCDVLTTEADITKETNSCEERQNAMLEFRRQVSDWIQQAEAALSDTISTSSSRRSNESRKTQRSYASRSSRSSRSSVSARAREKAKIAELTIERNLLKQQNELKMQAEQLRLEGELAKAKAREQIYAGDEQNLGEARVNQTVMDKPREVENAKISVPAASAEVQQQSQTLNPNMPEVAPRPSLNPTAATFTPANSRQDYTSPHPFHGVTSPDSLLAVLSLPQPEVTKFEGDVTNYRSFTAAFDTRVASRTSSSADKLYYLDQHVIGDSKDLISGCFHLDPEMGYLEARRLLDKEYGDSYKVAMAHLGNLNKWPVVKQDDCIGLKKLSMYLTKCYHAMHCLSDLHVLNHPPNLLTVVRKLPFYLQTKWREYAGKMRQVHQKTVVFQDLRDFVQRAADVANDPIFGKDALLQGLTQRSTDTKGTPNQGTPKANGSSFATNVTPDNSASEGKQAKTSCPLCSQSHDLESCKSFRAKTVDDRRAFIKDKFLCFGCYGPNHTARGCLQRRKCDKCQKPHPTLLHVDDYQPPRHQRAGGNHNGAASGGAQETQQIPVSHASDSDSARVSSAYAATTSNRSQPFILHGILPVKIHQRGSDQYVTTYCFYDNGSSGCFVSNDLFHQLGAKGTPTRLQLTTMHGVSHVDSSVVSDLIITDMDGNNAVSMPKTYTRDAIPVTAQHIPKPEVTSQWKHLQAIESKLPTFQPGLEVGILVGSNCPQALEPSDIIPTDGAGPYALRLRHGWTVYGPSKAPTQGEQVLCNRIFIQEAAKEEMSPEAIIQTLEMDFNERKPTYPDEKGQSQEDIKFMHMVEEKIQFENGHYIVPLPLRHTNVSLPNNRSQAMQRLLAQKKKMMRDQKYHSDYTAFVNKILDKDYAERVVSPQSNNDQRQTWYLPHHGIYNPNKPDKIRVVFDASAKYCGSSLNDHLLQGPDLANNLVGVLTRFRQHPTAFIADIEAMFFQVRVPVEQRNFLRFLWWEDGDINKEIQEFRMNVHLFGAISSPSVANFVLKKIGAISPNLEVQQTLKRNFYVDDCLKAVSTSTAAVSLIHELTATCAAKGFRLTKYTSNNPDVMKSIPTEEHSKEMLTRNLDYDELPVTRTLGIQWNAEQDQFGFAIEVKEKPMTRRGILSTISSLYDPLGFAAPVTLPAKQILQDLCREKNIGWDDKIPQEYLERWEKWRSAIGELTECRIERCCKPPNVAEEWKTELHVFADASMLGYGAVAFLRHLDQDGKFHMSFVMGKARIAPIKVVSIPRLELTAAVTSVRLSKLIEHEIDEELRVIYHTDSTTVLRFIRNERQRFPIFVANRVQLIRDFSTPQQWRYVPSAQNPADVGSRGITAKELQQSMWIHGPAFLEKDEGDWPEDPTELAAEFPNEALCDEQVGCNATQEQEDDAVTRLIHHYSDWFKLQYAVAVFQKVKQILKARIKHKKDDSTNQVEANLTVRDIKEAETSILKWLQHQRYPNEMTCLRSIQANQDRDRSLPRNSSLYRLDPYLVDGMMRVGGRLARANLSENEKHPIILPRKSHITTLAIRHEHERLGHAGRNHVLANLQTKYWIISGNSAVRTVINACVTCRRLRGQAQTQKMADLPACRVDETSPPFTQTGVDYFGPFVIKQGRKEVKRYGVIFTCMASRAIHLEASESLETDTFINVLRRFIARRGNVIQIWSDNGTNFKGAQKELRKSLEEMKSDQIQATMCKSGIEWRFNPPTASNMGGVWERMIRTVRKVLQGLMQDHSTRLDNDSFHTLLCEVEAIVNSRPIAYVSSDHKDLEALTPNHILTLKSKVTVPPPGIFRREDVYLRRRWRQVQYLAEQFWSRWKKEYLLLQQTRTKWTKQQRNIAVGDIVLIQDDNAPRNAWSMGRVQAVESDSKGLVRAALLKTQTTQLRRPINKMILLVPSV